MAAHVQSASVTQAGLASSTALAFSGTVTQGNILFAFSEWAPTSGNASGNVTSVTDTIGNVWHQIVPTLLGNNTQVGVGGPGFDLRWCLNKATTGTPTVTSNLALSYQNRKLLIAEYSGIGMVGLTPVDASASGITSGTSFSTATLTTLTAGDFLIMFEGTNTAVTFSSGPAGFTSRINSTNGALYDNLTGQAIGSYTETGTLSGGNDSGSYLIGVFASVYGYLGQFDLNSQWMDSNGIYTGLAPGVAQGSGNIFNGGYQGLTWMKNVFILPKDFWQQTLSTPYSGQNYPTPNTGGATSGQTYPY